MKMKNMLHTLSLCALLLLGAFTSSVWGGTTETTKTNVEGVWYSLYSDTEYTSGHTYTVVPPTDGNVIFEWRKSQSGIGGSYNGFQLDVSYSNDGSSYSDKTRVVASTIWEKYAPYKEETKAISGSQNAVKVKFEYGKCTRTNYYQNVRVKMAAHILLDNSDAVGVTSKSGTLANTVYGNTSAAYHIDLRSFLMEGTRINYVIENDNDDTEFHFGSNATTKYYDVLANSCAFAGGTADCASTATSLGDPDDYEADVYFTPAANKNGSSSATLYIKDGSTTRVTINLTAKVIPTYYFKATSVATDGTSTLDIPVRASFTSGEYSGSTMTVSQTAATADVASLTKTAYFYAPASQGDFQFQGWYETAACNGERVSTDNTISFNITSNALSAGTAVEKKYYAKYLEEIRAEFGGSDQVLMVDGGYDGISYSRTSEEHPTAAASAAEAAAAGKHFWYEIIVDDKTDVTTGSDDDSKVIDFDPSSNHVTAVNAGTARLILHQEATGLYVDVDKTYTFTVNKHEPEFTWYSDANTVYYNETIENFCTSNNAATSITRNSSVENVASISGATLTTYNKTGTTRITMTQAENYYWNEYSEWRDVTPVKTSNHVEFTLTTANQASFKVADKTTGTVVWDSNGYKMSDGTVVGSKPDNNVVLKFEGIPDSLYFSINAERNGVGSLQYYPKSGDYNFEVFESATGDAEDWHKLEWGFKNDDWFNTNYLEGNDSKRHIGVVLSATARYIRLRYHGSCWGRFENIRVTELKQFKTDSTSFDFKTQIKNANVPSKSFKFKHANAGYTVTATSNDSHYKVSLNNSDFYSSIIIPNTGGDRMDSSVVYVKYYPSIAGDVEETHNATITFSDALSNSATVSLTGKTQAKLATHLEYIGSDSYSVNADNIAATSLFQVVDPNGAVVASPTITLSSSNTSAINTVSSNTALDFLCGADNVRITASYAGDDDYAAASNSGTFYHDIDVTRNAASFTWSNVADDDKIHVWADSDIPSSIVSANTAINGLTSGNSDRLTVSGSKGSFSLHAGHKGEVTLTATSEGDCTYLNGTSSKTIVVEPCFHGIVWNQNFMALTASAEGEIDEEFELDAYAVDSSNVATNVTINYSLKIGTIASLDGTTLTVSGVGIDTLIATTVADNKYAVATSMKIIRVRREGDPCNSYALNVSEEKRFSKIGDNDYVIDGLPNHLSCQVKKLSKLTITGTNAYIKGWSKSQNDWVPLKQIYEQVDNTSWTDLTYDFTDEQSRDITKIKFTNSIEDGSKYVRNVLVTQRTYFTADVSSINRTGDAPVMVNTPFTQDIVVSYSDVPHIQYRLEGAVAEVLTLEPTETITNDCGDYGTYTFRLSGTFSKAKAYSTSHIYIYHSAGDIIDIPVNITVACNGTFKFQTANGEWETSSNWTLSSATDHGRKPDIASEVDIKKTVTITSEVSAYSIDLTNNDAKLIIMPGGGLTIGAGGIVGATPAKLELRAGTEDPVKGKTGYLRISPSYTDTMPHAKVEMYSIAYHNISSDESDDAKWQHVGIPVATDALAKTFFSKSWIYSYEESSDTWVNNRKTLVMEPFVGYATTQYKSEEGMLVTFPGQLVPNRGTKIIDLEYSGASYGHNRIANSYAAPIDITQFRDTDFIRAEKTIYIYNTGSKNNSSLAKSATGNNAGQWTAVSIGTAAEMAERFAADPSLPKTIAPMQGFCVNAQAEGAKFKLNYNKLVWNADYTSHAPTALRAPKRNADAAEEEEMPITGSMKMTLEANGLTDNIYLLESERYMTDFEDGYDAHKMESGTLNIFTVENEDKLAIDATNSIIGTRVGVRTGEETAYTITFSYVDGEQEWALYDAETDEMIDITNDNTYTFFAEPNSNITERFMIVESNGAQIPAVTTGNDKVTSDVRAHKFIKDGELFILKNGVLYDVTGARVK